ncbi:MAG TPA: gamma-glutamyltransferase [Longimicrobiales bacterium]|nr:gamma-glutamyltransferase [Longimicrobiales bacterium]
MSGKGPSRPRSGVRMPPPSSENWPASWLWGPDAPAVTGARGMVATTDRLATDVGVEVLRAGGNAVDAAVAASFALAVVNPEAGNVGGGGFMLVRTREGAVHALDHRSTAPAGATGGMFSDGEGGRSERAELGHLAVAVPGSVAGLWEAHGRFGVRPWPGLVEPAVGLARGFTVTDRYVRSLRPHIVDGLRRFPESEAAFLPGGRVPEAGDVLRQGDLARTLERIRDRGTDGFYRGETAALIVEEMERGGGLLTLDDLAGYAAVWRPPVRFGYRGHTVVSVPPPSSGGLTMAEAAHILEAVGPSGRGGTPWHGPGHVHRLVEAWRRAFADRNHYLADPDFVALPSETLASRAYGRFRASTVAADRATPSSAVGPGVEAFRGEGRTDPTGASPEGRRTTHLSVVDARGMAVAATTTLNTWYGSKLVVPGTGVLLNNEMDDFTATPGVPNHFGLVQGEANAIEPGKRPLSAMTPTLVLDPRGELFLVVGTPGGGTIITTTMQVISNMLDHGMGLSAAVRAPRVHHQHLPDRIDVEPGGLPAEVVAQLEELGHTVRERDEPSGDVQAVLVGDDGRLEGVSDPRRGGVAAGP